MPDLREERVDRLRREDADAVERSVVQQHAPDAGDAARRNSAGRPAARTASRSRRGARARGRTARRPSRTPDRPGGRRADRPSAACPSALSSSTARAILRVAAGRPVIAGVEPHRLEHVAAHPDVEPLTGHALDDRPDDRKIEVGVAEIIVARAVNAGPSSLDPAMTGCSETAERRSRNRRHARARTTCARGASEA